MPNGIAGLIIHEDKNSSYADLDFSQVNGYISIIISHVAVLHLLILSLSHF